MKQRLNAVFPALVMIVVAVAQIWRAHTIDQSPWKGGGFGMFASGDTPIRRFLKCRVATAEGELPVVDAPDALQRLLVQTRVAPSEANLRRIAASLATERTVRRSSPLRTEGGATAREASRSSALRFLPAGAKLPEGYEEVPFTSVTIEMWRVDFDDSALVDRASLLRAVTMPAARR